MNFIDKKGEKIDLRENSGRITAYNASGREVGFIDFDVKEFCDSYSPTVCSAYVNLMHIDGYYRRRGIATAIMQYAKQVYGNVAFYEDSGYGGKSGMVHYSAEGLAFKRYCEAQGITQPLGGIDDDE